MTGKKYSDFAGMLPGHQPKISVWWRAEETGKLTSTLSAAVTAEDRKIVENLALEKGMTLAEALRNIIRHYGETKGASRPGTEGR